MFGMKKETQFHLRENGSGGRGGGGRGGGGRGVGGGGAGKDLLDFRADSLDFSIQNRPGYGNTRPF